MNNIVLLRFHKDIDIVQNRIDLLHYFNKNIKIYGLFGGNNKDFEFFRKNLKNIENVTLVKTNDIKFKWQYSDITILEWYKELGHNINFDYVYTLEYDLIILDELKKVIKTLPNSIILTALININDIKEQWQWITRSPFKESSEKFMVFMKKNYKLKDFYGCLAPGATFSKKFLQIYSETDIPVLAHDELRMPQLAQAFGIELVDNNFYDNWNEQNPKTEEYFNCQKHEVTFEKILEGYKFFNRKVFHPVYQKIDTKKLIYKID